MTEHRPYVLEQRPEEIARLVAYAEREAEDVRMVCRRIALGKGGRAVDVGCGPLGAIATLADVVGESGEVFGLDSNGDALGTARALVERFTLNNVTLIEGDIITLDFAQLELLGRFDFAYCRLVLLHQADPLAFLQRIVELVAPGGYIAYQDIVDDPTRPRCEPPVIAQARAWELILQMFARRGLSPDVARDHSVLAKVVGCELVHQRGKFPVMAASDGFEIIRQLLIASRHQLCNTGLARSSEVDALLLELEAAKTGSYRYWHGPLAVETISRKPSIPRSSRVA